MAQPLYEQTFPNSAESYSIAPCLLAVALATSFLVQYFQNNTLFYV